MPENELPDNGTFGKDGQKVDSDAKAESSTSSISSPPAKKQCNEKVEDDLTSSKSSTEKGNTDSSNMNEPEKVPIVYFIDNLKLDS